MKDIPRFVTRFARSVFDYNDVNKNKLYSFKIGFTKKQFTQIIDDDIPLADDDGMLYPTTNKHIDIPNEFRGQINELIFDIVDWNTFVGDDIKVNFIILYFVDGIYYWDADKGELKSY